MKRLLVEVLTQCEFRLRAQRLQFGVTVEIRGGLSGNPVGVALYFILCPALADDHVFHDQPLRFFGRDQAEIQHRVEKHAGRAHQAILQAD